MIAKKKVLNVNEISNSSLQFSLQRCQLSPCRFILAQLALSLPKQMLLQTACKEKAVGNQVIGKFAFVDLFANNSN